MMVKRERTFGSRLLRCDRVKVATWNLIVEGGYSAGVMSDTAGSLATKA